MAIASDPALAAPLRACLDALIVASYDRRTVMQMNNTMWGAA